jgi:hypothetical protein
MLEFGVGLVVATVLHALVFHTGHLSSPFLFPGFIAHFLITGLHGDDGILGETGQAPRMSRRCWTTPCVVQREGRSSNPTVVNSVYTNYLRRAKSVREHHLGFNARIVVVLSIDITENLECEITCAMRRSDAAHAEVIFH